MDLIHSVAHGSDFLLALDDMDGQSHRAALFNHRATHRLTHPPVRVGDEFESSAGLKLFQGPHQPNITLLNQVEKGHVVIAKALGLRHLETAYQCFALQPANGALDNAHIAGVAGTGKLAAALAVAVIKRRGIAANLVLNGAAKTAASSCPR